MSRGNFTLIAVMFIMMFTSSVFAQQASWVRDYTIENGNTVFGSQYKFLVEEGIQTSNGNTLVVGSFYASSLQGAMATLLTPTGTVIWSKVYPGTKFYTCRERTASEYVLAGQSNQKGFLVRIGTNGSIVSALEFPGMYNIRSLIKTNDGGILFAGMETSSSRSYPVLVKYDSSFSVEWRLEIEDKNAFLYRDSLVEIPNNGFYVAAGSSGVFNINNALQLDFNKRYTYATRPVKVTSLHSLQSGGVMLAGQYLGYTWYATFCRLYGDGVPAWTSGKSFSKTNMIKSFEETPTGKYRMTGNAYYSPTQAFLVEVDSLGDTDWTRKIQCQYNTYIDSIYSKNDSIYVIGDDGPGGTNRILLGRLTDDGGADTACNVVSGLDPSGFDFSTSSGAFSYWNNINSTISVDSNPQNISNILSVTPTILTTETLSICEKLANFEVDFDSTECKKVEGRLIGDDSVVIDCGDGNSVCSADLIGGEKLKLTAYPEDGYSLEFWYDGVAANSVFENPTTMVVEEDVTWTALFRQGLSFVSPTEGLLDVNGEATFTFTLTEMTSIAILSAGNHDLKARVLNSNNVVIQDRDGNDWADDYKDATNTTHTNFMYRKSNLGAGTYTLEVESNDQPFKGESFSLVFLKRANDVEGFFTGMNALLGDNYTSNDYLDIYVKALYPELYSSLNTVSATNYGNSIPDQNGIIRERQCKALVNFFVHEFLGKSYLRADDVIFDNWSEWDDDNSDCIADDDYILGIGEGDLIYHSQYEYAFGGVCDSDDYFYNPDTNHVSRTGNEELSGYVKRGDIFVQRLSGYNHYGIVIDEARSFDANAQGDGMLHWKGNAHNDVDQVRITERWKISRPN